MLAVRLTLGQIKNFILTIAGQLPPQLVKGGGRWGRGWREGSHPGVVLLLPVSLQKCVHPRSICVTVVVRALWTMQNTNIKCQ